MNKASVDRVPPLMKFGYSSADLGANLAYHSTGFYLMFFFTDVFGILPALAGAIFLYSKVWDAISDPIMGAIADRTKSRWGRFRPYLLFGSVPLGLTIFLLWFAPEISENVRFIYGLATFMLFSTAITVVLIPYHAITPSLTLDSHERSVVLGFRAVFSIIGTLIAAGATLALVGVFGGEDQVIGFRRVGLLYGFIVAGVIIFCFATVRERVRPEEKRRKTSIKEYLNVIGQNPPFIILSLGVLMNMTGMNILAVVVTYFLKYNLNAENLVPVAFVCLFVAAAASMPLFVFISKKTSKKTAYNIGMGIVMAMLLLIFFFGEINVWLTIGIFALAGVGLSTNWLNPWSMIADTVEYSQWKTGLRREGILYGVFYFIQKLCTAIGGFLVGTILAYVGYVANVEQTPQALSGIRSVFTLLPSVFLLAGIILISFYPISAALHKKITAEIEMRESNEA